MVVWRKNKYFIGLRCVFFGKKLVWTEYPNYFVERAKLLATRKASKMFNALLKYFSRWIISRASAQGDLWKSMGCSKSLFNTQTMGWQWYHETWNGQWCFWFFFEMWQQYSISICCIIHIEIIMFAKETITRATKSPQIRLLRLYIYI